MMMCIFHNPIILNSHFGDSMSHTANNPASQVATLVARKDIQTLLNNVDSDRFILVPLANNTFDPLLLTDLLSRVTSIAEELVTARKTARLDALVELLTPDIPDSEILIREARMVATARQAVIKSTQWLTAEQLSTLAGFSRTNPSAQPNKWKAKKMIFAIHNKGTDYFPVYALDPQNHRPLKILSKILDAFNCKKDGWGVAYWFASGNGFLGGKRPQDILQSNPEGVLAAAFDEVAGVTHG